MAYTPREKFSIVAIEKKNCLKKWLVACKILLLVSGLLVVTIGNMKGQETGKVLDNQESHGHFSSHTTSQTLDTTTIYGNWLYLDSKGTRQPIRYATVEIWNENISGGSVLTSTSTNSTGYFSTEISEFTKEDIIFVQLKSETTACMVTTHNDSVYVTIAPANYNISEGSLYIGSWLVPNSQSGAFHIMDVIIDSFEFIDTYDTPPSQVQVKWEDGNDTGGSYYENGIITIDGSPSEPDEWDVSVVAHEYGHFIYEEYSHYSIPTGTHSWNGHVTPELAWSEGWANFFQSAIKHYWGYPNPELYEETSWSRNLETSWHDPLTGPWDDSESSIGGILLDIYDSPNDGQYLDGKGDNIHESFAEIWDVVINYETGKTHFTIHDFWDGWFAFEHGYEHEMWQLFYEHGIEKNMKHTSETISDMSDHPVNSLSGLWSTAIFLSIVLIIPTIEVFRRRLLQDMGK